MAKKKRTKTRADKFFDELLAKAKAEGKYTPGGSVRADDLMRRLESDPEWVRKRDEREAEFERRHQDYLKIERPVVDDLREAGCDVESVWDLVNRSLEGCECAVPVLVEHLGRDSYPDKVRESCARALTDPIASDHFDVIYKIFQTMPNTGVNKAKWATANALGKLLNRDRLEKAFEILFDTKHDLVCKDALFDFVKRYKIPLEKRAAIEKMLSEIDWEKEGY